MNKVSDELVFEIFGSYFLEEIADGNHEILNPKETLKLEEDAGMLDIYTEEEKEIIFAYTIYASQFWTDSLNKASELFFNFLKIVFVSSNTQSLFLENKIKIEKALENIFVSGNLSRTVYFQWIHEILKDFPYKYPMNQCDHLIPECLVQYDSYHISAYMDFCEKSQIQKKDEKNIRDWSLHEIYDFVCQRVLGQEKAIQGASQLLYHHLRGHKRNVLFMGPTGCGKTEIWRVMKELYPNICIVDSSRITADGWKGNYKFSDIFEGMKKEEAEHAIIVMDEFDKLCEPNISSGGYDVSRKIQTELLKILEDGTIKIQKEISLGSCIFETIDTSKVSFVFCGTFEYFLEQKNVNHRVGFLSKNLSEDNYLITPIDLAKRSNIRIEICSRIHQIYQLKSLEENDLNRILDGCQCSLIKSIEKEWDISIHLKLSTRKKLIFDAMESKMGVRYMRSSLIRMLDDALFNDGEKDKYSI